MPVYTIQQPGTRICLESERLQILFPPALGDAANQKREEVRLAEVERLVLTDKVSLSSAALGELLRRGIPVAFVSHAGRLLGSFEAPQPARAATRLVQYTLASDPIRSLTAAAALILAKIANQRRLLQRLNASHHLLSDGSLLKLGVLMKGVPHAQDVGTLMGIEGHASQLFYFWWSRFLPAEFPFEKRSTRPPLNAVNACISFIASLVYGECVSATFLAGLDPGLGCLHATQDGRWSLALDLLEPFRPGVVIALTTRLFSHRILQKDDFEPKKGGIYLNTSGRKTLLEHYENRMNREFFSEHTGNRTTMRKQLALAPLLFRQCLHDPALFSPFRIN